MREEKIDWILRPMIALYHIRRNFPAIDED